MREDRALTPPGGGAHVEPWLDAYRTGELAEAERLRVARHLERCPDCAARLAEIESFGRLVARGFAAAAAVPPAAEPDWPRQRREILARTMEPPVERRPARLFRFAPQAALGVLALLVLGILARQGVHAPRDLQRALQGEKAAESAPAASAPSMEGREAPAPAARFPERRQIPALSSDSFAKLSRPDRAAATAAPEATAPADAERERAAALNQAVPRPALGGAREPAKEAQVSGRDRGVQAQPRAAGDEGLAADQAGPPRPEAAPPTGPASMDALQRLDLYARKALASGDSADAGRALVFWRDSVALRQDLDPARKRAAAALVDSLANRVQR